MLIYDIKIFNSLIRELGFCRILEILHKIRLPVRKYYVRINTFKTSAGELLDKLREKGLEVYSDLRIPDAVFFPVKGPFKIPIAKKSIIVDKFTAESVIQGADLYAPGVVRGDNIKPGDEVTIYAPNGTPIAYGISVMSMRDILHKRRGLAVRNEVSIFKAPRVRSLKEYEEGLFYDQSLPAILVSHVLEPKKREKIVDLCASPGGKTTHIAQLTKGLAKIYAIDRSLSKIRKIEENIARLGLKGIQTIIADSRKAHLIFPSESIDKVLLDPPCSSLGVRPKIIDNKKFTDIVNLSRYQESFFRPAYKILKKGGVLVYSTCTITIEENEGNIKKLTKLGFELIEQPVYIGEPGLGLGNYSDLVQRFLPDRIDTPGYFIAKLVKK